MGHYMVWDNTIWRTTICDNTIWGSSIWSNTECLLCCVLLENAFEGKQQRLVIIVCFVIWYSLIVTVMWLQYCLPNAYWWIACSPTWNQEHNWNIFKAVGKNDKHQQIERFQYSMQISVHMFTQQQQRVTRQHSLQSLNPFNARTPSWATHFEAKERNFSTRRSCLQHTTNTHAHETLVFANRLHMCRTAPNPTWYYEDIFDQKKGLTVRGSTYVFVHAQCVLSP